MSEAALSDFGTGESSMGSGVLVADLQMAKQLRGHECLFMYLIVDP